MKLTYRVPGHTRFMRMNRFNSWRGAGLGVATLEERPSVRQQAIVGDKYTGFRMRCCST